MEREEKLKLFEQNRTKIEQACRETVELHKKILDENTKMLHDSLVSKGIDTSRYNFDEPDYEKEYRDLIQEEIEHCNDEEYGCEKTINGVDISEQLAIIAEFEKEAMMAIAIKNNKVVDCKYTMGTSKTCPIDGKEFMEVVNKYKDDKDAIVFVVHNHPFRVSAKPSGKDPVAINFFIERNNLNKEQFPWGVVTKYDFYKA